MKYRGQHMLRNGGAYSGNKVFFLIKEIFRSKVQGYVRQNALKCLFRYLFKNTVKCKINSKVSRPKKLSVVPIVTMFAKLVML